VFGAFLKVNNLDCIVGAELTRWMNGFYPKNWNQMSWEKWNEIKDWKKSRTQPFTAPLMLEPFEWPNESLNTRDSRWTQEKEEEDQLIIRVRKARDKELGREVRGRTTMFTETSRHLAAQEALEFILKARNASLKAYAHIGVGSKEYKEGRKMFGSWKLTGWPALDYKHLGFQASYVNVLFTPRAMAGYLSLARLYDSWPDYFNTHLEGVMRVVEYGAGCAAVLVGVQTFLRLVARGRDRPFAALKGGQEPIADVSGFPGFNSKRGRSFVALDPADEWYVASANIDGQNGRIAFKSSPNLARMVQTKSAKEASLHVLSFVLSDEYCTPRDADTFWRGVCNSACDCRRESMVMVINPFETRPYFHPDPTLKIVTLPGFLVPRVGKKGTSWYVQFFLVNMKESDQTLMQAWIGTEAQEFRNWLGGDACNYLHEFDQGYEVSSEQWDE